MAIISRLFFRSLLTLIICTNFYLSGSSQTIMPLYPDSIPNSKASVNEERIDTQEINSIPVAMISKVSRPTLTVFLPPKDKATGTAIIICPGGGYFVLAVNPGGFDVVKKLNEMGIAVFLLKYRIPDDHTMLNKEIGPLQDAQRAIQLIREKAAGWNIRPDRIGIMGFSVGGHLASTAGTHFDRAVIDNNKHISLRPDFMALIYPLISFDDSIGHMFSRENLLGKHPSPEKIKEYSSDQQVTSKTPPAFIVQCSDDDEVKVQNSLCFYESLLKNGIPAELHIYQKGGHFFGLNNPATKDQWIERLQNWLSANGWMTKN
jgi:acetyl esterase/lipase